MSEKKKFKAQDLGPLPEKVEVPEWIGLEAHKGYIIAVWKEGRRPRSGFISADDTWQISR